MVHKLLKLYTSLYKDIQKFPKLDKFSLGLKIENLTLEIIENILLARTKLSASQILVLNKADVQLKLLGFFWRIAFETKTIEQKKYIGIQEKILEIGKILGGWLKKAKERV